MLKAFAGRDEDWIAIRGVLICQGDKLDWDYIHEQLPPLCELNEDAETPARLEEMRRRLEAS